tara:strand:+ start:111 stop:416 length:306 start_codon:yes stop_codon:yes gene_type:complete
MPDKKTPISQEQWDEMESHGLNPEEMNFRIKGKSLNKNITRAPEETQETYGECEEKLGECDTWMDEETGYEMEVGIYAHRVAGQTPEMAENKLEQLKENKK